MKRSTYLKVADEIAAEISVGILTEGERLPPQRQFAYERGIATSTVSRVYEELIRRGLVLGEIGRGTYVRAIDSQKEATLVEPVSVPIDLEHNYSVRGSYKKKLMNMLSEISEDVDSESFLTPMGAVGWRDSKKVASKYISCKNWIPKQSSILFSGNGRQAISAALSAITKPGDSIGVEDVTYPVLIGIAQKMGLVLVPIEMDEDGIKPDILEDLIKTNNLKALYLQPTLQSPTAITMSHERREVISKIITKHELPTIEDGVYNFLAGEKPLCAYSEKYIIYIDSLSKSLAPGVALGIISSPKQFYDKIKSSLQFGAWTTSGLLLGIGTKWMASENFKEIIREKRSDALVRQNIVRKIFSDFNIKGDDRAYHVWVPLLDIKNSDLFASRMLRMGIAITPGSAFSVVKGVSPNYIRVSLASPEKEQLVIALKQIHRHLTA